MGRSEAGKTSLTQALKGEELHYHKTQYTNTKEDTIDVPMMTKEAAADVLLDAFSGGKRFLSGQEISN